ncbi:hypothetical protein ACRAWC_10445 [Leifsonia sp. L25]|uniref:hypothetical protein n=1 Tax=Actinomycetes TaxID=1760 RepID=UPI003D6861D7
MITPDAEDESSGRPPTTLHGEPEKEAERFEVHGPRPTQVLVIERGTRTVPYIHKERRRGVLVLFRIDRILYRPIEDVRTSKAAIVAAARAGGAFVPFLSPTGVSEIFITASTAVRIELVDEETSDGPFSEEPDGSSFGFGDL